MADVPAAVTDTHALLLHAAGGRGLGTRAAQFFERCERQQALVYVPAIVMWECSLLARVARVNLRRTVRGFFDDLFSNPAYQPLDLTPEQVCVGDELRFHRMFSFGVRPKRVLNRRSLTVDNRRLPEGPERLTMPGHWIILACTSGLTPVEIAMAESTVTGFSSWIEAGPPGQTGRITHRGHGGPAASSTS